MKRYLLPVIVTAVTVVLCSSTAVTDSFTKEEITSYAKSIGIPKEDLYFIRKDLQQQYLDIGQPNTIVLDNDRKRLKAATCYEEFPYYLDTFYEFKSQVKDTLTMYDMKFDGDTDRIIKTFDNTGTVKIDPSKKYHIFYYFAKYAKFKDKLIKKSVKKYKDSVQYFFINVDKIKE
jgi:hypothetical protein